MHKTDAGLLAAGGGTVALFIFALLAAPGRPLPEGSDALAQAWQSFVSIVHQIGPLGSASICAAVLAALAFLWFFWIRAGRRLLEILPEGTFDEDAFDLVPYTIVCGLPTSHCAAGRRRGVLVDVHLKSEGGRWDLILHAQAPIRGSFTVLAEDAPEPPGGANAPVEGLGLPASLRVRSEDPDWIRLAAGWPGTLDILRSLAEAPGFLALAAAPDKGPVGRRRSGFMLHLNGIGAPLPADPQMFHRILDLLLILRRALR